MNTRASVSFRLWTLSKDRSMWLRRGDRLEAGFYVFVRTRFVARQGNVSAIQIYSGHMAGIDQRLMTIGPAPRG